MTENRWIPIVVALCAVALAAPAIAEVRGEPPWIHELIQEGETVEVGLYHTYLMQGPDLFNKDEELLTLARFGPGDEVKVLFDKRLFTRDDDDVTCNDPFCDGYFDEEGCAENPDWDCHDCDGDDVDECTHQCSIIGCQTIFVDDCAPPGDLTYVLYGAMSASDLENIDCEHPYEEQITVADVGQDCPSYDDAFDCYEPADAGAGAADDQGGSSQGCGCAIVSSLPANPLVPVLLAIGLGGLLLARRRS